MKYIIPLFVIAIFTLGLLSACQQQPEGVVQYKDNQEKQTGENMQDNKDNSMQNDNEHIGCQEGEIDVNGNCLPAENNNAMLFGQDFSDKVATMDVTEPQGYLAKPKIPGTYPGIIMIHEWWGLNDNIKEMARILASQGYIVFAVDLYGGEVATDSDKARELATAARNNPDKAIADMQAAAAYLREEQDVTRLASLGWCFGGQQSLQLSLNEELDATIIYYGNLVNDTDELKTISGPVLGIFGEEDTGIPPSSVHAFESALNSLDVPNDITIYPWVGHAFANPSGSNYASEETKDAWKKTVAFLNKNLKSQDGKESIMTDEPDHIFTITGINYKFLMDGEENPEIRVKQGDTITIEFSSTEGFHDWALDEFDTATDKVRPENGMTSTTFTADEKGTFEYYCSVGSHRENGMKGNLIVE